jgi:hypothetical protein
MKKVFLLLAVATMVSFSPYNKTLSKEEKKYAVKFLKDTEKGVFDAVKGLSDAQLKFKPAADRWSVEECVKHIAISETNLWGMTDGSIKMAANPEKRGDIKMTDDQVIKGLEDRTNKVKTADAFKPENTPFKSTEDALASFKQNREKLIEFVKNTNEDLRNHVSSLPMGSYDAYQMILFIGAHSNRHTQQIEEVKADPNFPKS